MGWFYVFSAIGIIGVICFIYAHFLEYYDDRLIWHVFGFIACGFSFIVLVGMGVSLTDINHDFDLIKDKYYNLKEQIEYCQSDDIVTDRNLREEVLEMNNTIAEHRNYSKSFWNGVWYSEEIGNLPNLKWKSKKNP